MTTDALSRLHARYDGPLPRPALDAARLGGPARRDTLRLDAECRLFDRLAADARLGIARRRAATATPHRDAWLARLIDSLARHRTDGVRRIARSRGPAGPLGGLPDG